MSLMMQRPVRKRMIAGVCAGLAESFGTTPTVVRVLFLLSCLLPGPQVLIYLALWVLMPREGSSRAAHDGPHGW